MLVSAHLVILPIILPMLAALLQLLPWGAQPQRYRRAIGILASMLAVLLSIQLLIAVDQGPLVYALGNWQAPFGIVLVADKLSALMILLTNLLALPVLIYSCYGEDNLGSHFQALFQFQLLGIIGAFLTGDLFNLFVFLKFC